MSAPEPSIALPATAPSAEAPPDLFAQAAALRRAGEPFALATVIWSQRPTSARPGARAIIRPDGSLTGWIGGSCAQPVVVREALRALHDGQTRLVRLSASDDLDGRDGVVMAAMTCQSGGTLEVFIEPYQPPLQLIVVGDSPIAASLARLGSTLGYRITAASQPVALSDMPAAGRPTAVVVATMGHNDEEAVATALRSDAPYVAVVASQRRLAALLTWLRATGLTERQLARLKGPAGLDIGATTPDEVAISIIAEIIARRAAPSTPASAAPAPETAIDPVCGMSVPISGTRHTSEHAGVRYFFCCPSCRRQFEREPARFLTATPVAGD